MYKKIDGVTKYIAVAVGLIIALYNFLPEVVGKPSPISIKDVEILLKDHDSFTQSKYSDRMNSLYHPNFTMTAIHSTGNKETFNKDQLLKHHQLMNQVFHYSLNTISQEISLINDSQAMVSIISEQKSNIGLVKGNVEVLYQSILVTNRDGAPTFLNVISIAKNK